MLALNLHDHPDARRRIVADMTLIAPAIEESLRFNTSAQRFKRTVMREIAVHGQTLHPGDKVVLAFGSGNRDRRKFGNPDVYDIDRRPQGHLGFGSGKHFCLGSQMARLVTRSSDEAVSRARPRLSPHGRPAGVEFVVEFPQPGRVAVRVQMSAHHPGARSNSAARNWRAIWSSTALTMPVSSLSTKAWATSTYSATTTRAGTSLRWPSS